LRWGAPITSIDRLTAADVELAGVPIPRNSLIRVCIAAANRDEAIWSDPDKFDIAREQKRALPFGYGAHVCIGQHLARMELQMALNVLLDRLPNVRLDPDKPPPVIHGLTFRGADAVHVKWD
jgi:cytochrome P450